MGVALTLAARWGLAADLNGSMDPLDIPRFPHSWIVSYENDERYLPREYVLGRVDKTRRDVRVEHEVRASATRQRVTYEMPPGTDPALVVAHYQRLIGSDPLFSCRGRDCGRSNLWANEIFKQAMLYGPDANQYYFAGEYQDRLIALYVIERGNKRIYAHLEVLTPERQVALSHNDEILERLAGEGLATIDDVSPASTGRLTEEDRTVLNALSAGMDIFKGQTVYVVCHLYGSEDAPRLLENAAVCAQQAAEVLASGFDADSGPVLIPFAAGPLLPRVGKSARLELILPHRLSHLR